MQIPIQDLSQPFTADQVKKRRGNHGKQLDYVEASTVINRLNHSLEGDWGFRIVEYKVESDEVLVIGEMQIVNAVRQQFGGSRITRNKDTGEAINIADDLKSATSDALKKCAAGFGVALHLYSDSNPVPQTNGNPTSGPSHINGSRITNDQIVTIFQAAKEHNLPQSTVIKMAKDSFSTSISNLSPDQAIELVAMIHAA